MALNQGLGSDPVTPDPDTARPVIERSRRMSNDLRAALAIALVLLGVYWTSMGGHTTSVDGEGYLAATRALLHGTTAVTPGPDLKGIVVLVPDKNGNTTTITSPGAVLLFVPGFVLGKVIAAPFPHEYREDILRLVFLSANSVFTALTGALVFLLCRALKASTPSSALLAFAYGLGTWAWPHSQTDFSEPATAMLVTAATLMAVNWWARPESKSLAALTGLCIGAAVTTRSSIVLFVPVFLASGLVRNGQHPAIRRWRAVMWFGIGGALPAGLNALNSWVKFGGVFKTGYPPLPYTTPVYEGVFGLFFSTGKGLFFYAPVCIVSLFALRTAYLTNRRYTLTIGSILVVHLAVYSRFAIWSGENAYGPRYLVPVLPILVVIPALVIDSGRHWVRGVRVSAAVGFLIPGLLGSLMYFNAVYFAQQPRVAVAVDNPNPTATQQYLAWNFYPRTSPLMLHFRSIPLLVENTAKRISSTSDLRPIPPEYRTRIYWYAERVELDTWWAWWSFKGGPWAIYTLAAIPLAALGFGLRLGARTWRGSSGTEPAQVTPARCET